MSRNDSERSDIDSSQGRRSEMKNQLKDEDHKNWKPKWMIKSEWVSEWETRFQKDVKKLTSIQKIMGVWEEKEREEHKKRW